MKTLEFLISSRCDTRAGLCSFSLALLVAAAPACGGSRSTARGNVPGQSHHLAKPVESSPASVPESDDDLETPTSGTLGANSSQPGGSAGESEPGDLQAGNTNAAPVTFVLRNTADDILYLNMDKGWQAVIYAYSGTPPNAKSMLMFPTFCTASCDSSSEELCPICPEPQRVQDIKAAEHHDPVAPGESREVPWDTMAFAYKKTKKGRRDGGRVSCNCFDTVPATPATYTIKACGLRKTQSAKVRSKYQCVSGSLTLPVTEPVRVELDFGE